MSGVFRVLHTKCKTIVNIDCYFWSIIKPCDWHLKYILVFFPFLRKIVIVFSSICLTCYQGMNWICLTGWYELSTFEKIHPPGDQSKVCRGHQLLIQLDLLCLPHVDVTLFVYFSYIHENANSAQIWHKIMVYHFMRPLPQTRSRWLSRSQGPCHGKEFANWKRVKDLCLPWMTLGPCVVDSLHFGVGQVVLLEVVALFHPGGRRERPSWNYFLQFLISVS